MPIKEIPQDYEVIAHPANTPALGEHSYDNLGQCGVGTAQPHRDRDGDVLRWNCTRKKGHLGRHEAASYYSDGPRLWLSWADRPAE